MIAALQRLRFTANAATSIVNEQQIDSIEEYRRLSDDECENLCKIIRRPGGTIENPRWATATAAQRNRMQERIPNPGNMVSQVYHKSVLAYNTCVSMAV